MEMLRVMFWDGTKWVENSRYDSWTEANDHIKYLVNGYEKDMREKAKKFYQINGDK
jgi:hypothetical protein